MAGDKPLQPMTQASLYRWIAVQVERGALRQWAELFAPGKSRSEKAALLRQVADRKDRAE